MSARHVGDGDEMEKAGPLDRIGGSGKRVLITGGAGFIGSNLADRLASRGVPVTLFDNLSRPSVEQNLAWLTRRWGALVTLQHGDLRDAQAVGRAVHGVERVFHLAAQVAVTSSLVQPVEDFDINARGTLLLLEAIRAQPEPPPLLFTSTNKVYGALADVPLRALPTRYRPEDEGIAAHGISEARPLEFHSPYGCSKGSADQYVLDYARAFGLPAVVFRMSCIYGPRQFGTEDQGWVAHFLRAASQGGTIALYGDGKQVRDLLYIDDLVDALLAAQEHIGTVRGRAWNVGGGPENTMSLVELMAWLGSARGRAPHVEHHGWRTGDQRYYVSDCRALTRAIGWRPRVGTSVGLERLGRWIASEDKARAEGVA